MVATKMHEINFIDYLSMATMSGSSLAYPNLYLI